MRPEFKHLKRNPFGKGFIIDPTASSAVKTVDESKGIVQGYFASFGNVDSYRDIITPGAFAKTIRDRGPEGSDRIQHLLNHDWTHRIGRITELEEDEHGLLFTSKLMKEHSKGRDALIEYQEGVLREHSIGFDIIKWEYDADEDILMLLEIRLWEGSGVTWGANDQTPTIDVKALQNDTYLFEHMALQLKAMESALTRPLTDERARELTTQVEDFKRSFRLLEDALLKEAKPAAATSPDSEPQTKEDFMLAILKQLKSD